MLRVRLLTVSLFFCLVFALALVRLGELQFLRSAELVAYRDRRLSHMEQKTPRRGRILDADGKALAEDQPTQDVWLAPARRETVNRRRRVLSNLPPLSAEQMLALSQVRADEREFEQNLAVAALVDGNPMVTKLAERLKLDTREVAEKIVAAIVSGRPSSTDDLVSPRLVIPDIDFALALEIRSSRANPYDGDAWPALEIRTGGKRSYPAGKVMAHIVGTVGKLTSDEYIQLRGQWLADGKADGVGRIVKQGRDFFSILSGPDGQPMTDEEAIIRLREVKRNGRVVRTQGYFSNEMVGRGGLEQYYNQALRGRHRLQFLRLARDEKSGARRFKPEGAVRTAENGEDIQLSIRLDAQKKAYDILERHIGEIAKRPELVASNWVPSGVAIMIDPRNGRIRAMVSYPSYDPNAYNRDFDELSKDPALPLLDRAIGGIYPPGSVVKPLVGLAGLSENAVMPGQRVHCDRVLLLGGSRFTCLGRHGDMDIESALMYSCNMFFYHTGEALGGQRLYRWYDRYGLGKRTGVDIAGESGGILPRNAYTRRGWATGNTYHMAIGQGIAITPLQIAVLYCALANADKGVARIVRPHVMIPPTVPPAGPAGEELAREALRLDQPMAEVAIDKDALAEIRAGMWKSVQGDPETGDFGTGVRASFPLPDGTFLLEIGGKTGTAEWSQTVRGAPVKQISHVWFAGYAPFDRPEIVVVVMLPEAGGGGGGTCAPIAKDLLRMWFNLPERPEYVMEEEDALG